MIPSKARPIPKPDAFAEALCHIDAKNNSDDEIHEWDKHQNDPPAGPADDLAPNVEIVDRDDAGPAGLAGFGEHFPHRHDQQQGDEQLAIIIETGLGAWPCDVDEYEYSTCASSDSGMDEQILHKMISYGLRG